MSNYLQTLLPALLGSQVQLPVPSEDAVQQLYAQLHGIAAFRVRPCAAAACCLTQPDLAHALQQHVCSMCSDGLPARHLQGTGRVLHAQS